MSELKHFKEFETYSEYETYINGKPMLPNVSFVGQDVYYKDGVPTPPTPPIPSIISAGMICYADSNNKLKFCTREEWDSTLGEVQGVVVVPSNHTPDGTARIICIDGVNTEGSHVTDNWLSTWGPTFIDTGLPNMDRVPTWDNTIGGSTGSIGWGRLPSNNNNGMFTGATCACDSLTKYQGSTPYIPSPYLEDGSQNPAYINTVEATTGNCLSDFNGKSNTELLAGLGESFTAAYACNLYGTTALPAGNWYLPAMGELGYIMPRFNEIQSALLTVGGVQLLNDNYWSSTEYDIIEAFCMGTNDGFVTYIDKEPMNFVRAFASVPVE